MKNGDTAPYSISPVPTEFLSDFSRYFKVQSPRKDQSFFFFGRDFRIFRI